MNKNLFYTGLFIFLGEGIIATGIGLSFVDWSFLNIPFIVSVIVGSAIALTNIMAFIFLIVGGLSEK